LAWLVMIQLLKIKAEPLVNDQSTLGSTFVEQILTVYQSDSNLNMLA